jgi:hypothetical protein
VEFNLKRERRAHLISLHQLNISFWDLSQQDLAELSRSDSLVPLAGATVMHKVQLLRITRVTHLDS